MHLTLLKNIHHLLKLKKKFYFLLILNLELKIKLKIKHLMEESMNII